MKSLFSLLIPLHLTYFYTAAQPANKVHWVGLETGTFNSSSWASSSGGPAGPYPSDVNYQLIFDGGGTAGKTYLINMNTTTGGYIVVENNTTVILQTNAISVVTISTTGYKIQAGSKLILENNGTGALLYEISAAVFPAYNSSVDGEMILKSPVVACTQFACPQIWLILSRLIIPNGTKVFNVSGILSMEGTETSIHVSNSGSLAFAANSNFILDTDKTAGERYTFDQASTITITGAGKGTSSIPTSSYLVSGVYGNVVYECPSQTVTRPLFAGPGWTVNGNLIITSTGSGKLAVSTGTVAKDIILQVQ